MARVTLDSDSYDLGEDELALVNNALVCYAEQLRVSEGEARMAASTPKDPDVADSLNRLAETHAHTQRRVKRLLEVIG